MESGGVDTGVAQADLPPLGETTELPVAAPTEQDLAGIWTAALNDLAEEMVPVHQRAWLRLSRLLGLVEGTAVVAAPNEFTKDLLESRLRVMITETLTRRLGRPITVAVSVIPTESATDATVISLVDDHEPIVDDVPPPPVSIAKARSHSTEPARLNSKYTFDNFVPGETNRMAHAAAVAVAEAPAKAYNPLFIYGESGLGKTHLLHAIGNYAVSTSPHTRVRYTSSEEFTNEFINALRDGKNSEFQRRYRDVDILLIDDIQFLEGKVQTQEEFFHTFNALHNATKQIVISSDRPPKELATLEERLRNRFEWGLLTDITPPRLETRIAILRRKAAQDRLTAPPEVLEFIANAIDRNIRELEGALIRVAAYASLNRQPMTLDVAQIVLRDLIPERGSPAITAGVIMSEAALYYGVSIDDLCSESRTRVMVTARQIAMYLCRELTDLSLPKIGQIFGGKDHTTVMHAYRKISAQMQERRSTYNQVAEITNRIKTRASQGG
jgi:chromosomal replication initiator protein